MSRPTIEERFPTAATSSPPTAETIEKVVALRDATVQLATLIEAIVPESRDKSIAMTALEDTLMRANRAVYAGAQRVDEFEASAPVDAEAIEPADGPDAGASSSLAYGLVEAQPQITVNVVESVSPSLSADMVRSSLERGTFLRSGLA